MKVAVLTLTRDRLEYTQHCFGTLRKNAGCPFDWYVLDQASTDGTPEWLSGQDDIHSICLEQNIGISRGMNRLLDEAVSLADYDAIVKFDNDCELVQPDTIRDVVAATLVAGDLLSPRILGLKRPPMVTGTFMVGLETILDIPQIGGIFLAAPASFYETFRFREDNPRWGLDDVQVCAEARRRGFRCGYFERLEAWHYETTDGQQARYPAYFDRQFREMARDRGGLRRLRRCARVLDTHLGAKDLLHRMVSLFASLGGVN